MAGLVAFAAGALVLLFVAAAIVGHWRERVVYDHLRSTISVLIELCPAKQPPDRKTCFSSAYPRLRMLVSRGASLARVSAS
jgi:hypothetical protein